jgi:hypothetical protein
MTVQIERSSVSMGSAGSVFDNDGGLLRISDLQVTNVVAASLVATANNGASFLERSAISSTLFERQLAFLELQLYVHSDPNEGDSLHFTRCSFGLEHDHLYDGRWIANGNVNHGDWHDAHEGHFLCRTRGQHAAVGYRHCP